MDFIIILLSTLVVAIAIMMIITNYQFKKIKKMAENGKSNQK